MNFFFQQPIAAAWQLWVEVSIFACIVVVVVGEGGKVRRPGGCDKTGEEWVGGLPICAKPAHLEQLSCSSLLSGFCFFPVDIYAHLGIYF